LFNVVGDRMNKLITLCELDLIYLNEAVKREQWEIVEALINNLNDEFKLVHKHEAGGDKCIK